MKVVIIGGVAGGASAAARLRRNMEHAEIILFEKGPDVSFANCGLPYYIGGEIADRSALLITTPEKLHARFNLDVRTNTLVEKIDRERKVVSVTNLLTKETYEESYDKLVLAPGAVPFKPALPGIDLQGIYTLRNLQDADHIYKRITDASVKDAVVIGAGFIGIEMVENLVLRGITTSLVEMAPQILPPVDPEMTKPLVDKLLENKVDVHLNETAVAFEEEGSDIIVKLKSGKELRCQLVVIGVGVRPDNTLAVDAGLEVGLRGGIRVNEHMQTTRDEDIYAVGDAVEVIDFVTKERAQIPLAGPANRQGRLAADHIAGKHHMRYRGTQATGIVGAFGLTIASTGAAEKTLKRLGFTYEKIYVHPNDHAGYYPGSEAMTIKLLFHPDTGLIYGGQIVGGNGVDKRCDVISVAIQAHMTVFDLEEMELSYSPQYGSAKDAINIAGFVGSNVVRREYPVAYFENLSRLDSPYVLDVRTVSEYSKGHLPNSVNIPVDELRSRLKEIPQDKNVFVYCQVGLRGYIGTKILLQDGFKAYNLTGGYLLYQMMQGAHNVSKSNEKDDHGKM